jgi:hypothetical protein
MAFSRMNAFESSMQASPETPRQNHLLGALPVAEWDRLRPQMELRPMPLGHVLYESGDPLRKVYFPTDSIVSLLYVMTNGASGEISVVGNEGSSGFRFSWAVRRLEPRDRAKRRAGLPRGRTDSEG